MAGNYGIVDNGIWRHHVYKKLPDEGKLLFLYMKTCEHGNMIGCFYLPMGYMIADTGWTEKKIKETLSILFEKGFCKYDETTEFILLPRHLVKHPLQNPKQVIGANRLIDEIPSEFIYLPEIIDIYNSQERVLKPYQKGIETVCNTETETETETETVPTIDDFKKYFDEKGYTEDSAIKAHRHYETLNWHDKQGKPVKNWKNKVSNNWFTPENQKPKTDPYQEAIKIAEQKNLEPFMGAPHETAEQFIERVHAA